MLGVLGGGSWTTAWGADRALLPPWPKKSRGDGRCWAARIEGTFHAHQVPLAEVHRDHEQFKGPEAWLRRTCPTNCSTTSDAPARCPRRVSPGRVAHRDAARRRRGPHATTSGPSAVRSVRRRCRGGASLGRTCRSASTARIPSGCGSSSRTRPDAVAGDKAHSSRSHRAHLHRRGIKAVIPERKDQAANRRRRALVAAGPSATTPTSTKSEHRRAPDQQAQGLARQRHPIRQDPRELPRRPTPGRLDDLDQRPHPNTPMTTTGYAP